MAEPNRKYLRNQYVLEDLKPRHIAFSGSHGVTHDPPRAYKPVDYRITALMHPILFITKYNSYLVHHPLDSSIACTLGGILFDKAKILRSSCCKAASAVLIRISNLSSLTTARTVKTIVNQDQGRKSLAVSVGLQLKTVMRFWSPAVHCKRAKQIDFLVHVIYMLSFRYFCGAKSGNVF